MLFSVNKNLLEALVLAILYKADSYGYKLTHDIKQIIDISESTLYPVLRRLQSEGKLKTYDKPIDGRNRKYYAITQSGVKQHLANIYEWQKQSEIFNQVFSEVKHES